MEVLPAVLNIEQASAPNAPFVLKVSLQYMAQGDRQQGTILSDNPYNEDTDYTVEQDSRCGYHYRGSHQMGPHTHAWC
jgi:hypothetical protein